MTHIPFGTWVISRGMIWKHHMYGVINLCMQAAGKPSSNLLLFEATIARNKSQK